MCVIIYQLVCVTEMPIDRIYTVCNGTIIVNYYPDIDIPHRSFFFCFLLLIIIVRSIVMLILIILFVF